MEVLEFILSTWWYVSLFGFLSVLAKAKIMDGEVTVNDLVDAILFGLGGYISLFIVLLLIVLILFSEIGDKKLF